MQCTVPADVYEARVAQVQEWQRFYAMEPRADSKLTVRYANGECGAMQADEVARELMCTDFLYKYTLYSDLLEAFLRRVAARLRRMYRISWKATWDIVRFYGPTALKLYALMSSHQCIPGKLPS